ncbi:MAG: AprI/Inh family metalloprotease inhibitor [Alphaproteobacteria bacterium]
MRRFVLLALAASLIVGAAQAQQPAVVAPAPPTGAQVDRAIGPWELSNPAGSRKCTLEFKATRTGPGYQVAFGPACREAFPATAAITAWSVASNGNLVWLDNTGKTSFDFGETEVGIFEALRPGDATVYFLTNLGLVGTQLSQPDEIAGTWGLGRPGQAALCTLTLRDDLAPGIGLLEQRFVLTVAPGCERSIAALALGSWRLERELLLMYGAQNLVLSFKRETDGRWQKVPPDNRPLTLEKR